MKKLFFLFVVILNTYGVEKLNDDSAKSFINSNSTRIKNFVYRLIHNDKQIALACAFDNNGHLITSLEELPKNTFVQNHDGSIFPVNLVGSDRKTQITVLKSPLALKSLNFSDTAVNTGKILGAINPEGCFAMGIVSLAPYKTTQSIFHHSIRFPLDARPKVLHVEENSPEKKSWDKVW